MMCGARCIRALYSQSGNARVIVDGVGEAGEQDIAAGPSRGWLLNVGL